MDSNHHFDKIPESSRHESRGF